MRRLETETLEQAARDYAGFWMQPDIKSKSGKVFINGPSRVLQDFKNFTFDDEHDFLFKSDAGIKAWLGGKALAEFEKKTKEFLPPRDPAKHVKALRDKLAIDPLGNHIPGVIGSTVVGTRPIARRMFEVETPSSIRRRLERGLPVHVAGRKDRETIVVPRLLTWNVYAGEAEERIAESGVADELPDDAMPTLPDGRLPADLNAANPNISAEAAIAGLDAILARLDEGSTPATIRGRTGTQPVDPDATETGTLLFTLTMSDPAFLGAADDSPGALATADTIADDSSADATNTLGYCRVGATGTGADDHIDGSVGTSSADFIFNTLAIVSGAVVSMSSFTVFLPQGATAT